jgi:hypothetical protein
MLYLEHAQVFKLEEGWLRYDIWWGKSARTEYLWRGKTAHSRE